MFENIEKPTPKFQIGQKVYHDRRREWVTLTECEISEKRWNDYGVVELVYFATSDEGKDSWGYESDFSESALTNWAGW